MSCVSKIRVHLIFSSVLRPKNPVANDIPALSNSMRALRRLLCTNIALCFFLSCHVFAEQVQFCKFGAQQFPAEAVDFCVSLSAHQNDTSQSHDVYLAMSVTRPQSRAHGWTAVGIGSAMKGSMMFVIYGVPAHSASPIVSIRTAGGYVPPEPISTTENVQIEVVESSWDSSGDDAVANILVACYSCTSWPGSTISASDSAQPWIWAWNKDQIFEEMSEDATLEPHSHKPEDEGTGSFYVDMVRAVTTDPTTSRPTIQHGVESVGAFEEEEGELEPDKPSKKGISAWDVHGLLMAVAFLLVLPAGAVGIRLRSSKAFKYHWVLQLLGSGIVFAGAIMGFMMSHRIAKTHQVVGLGIALCLAVQGLLGWRHHVIFMNTRRRSYFSKFHVYLGRASMLVGWSNLLSGLSLAGYHKDILLGMALLVTVEATALFLWMWSAGKRDAHTASGGQPRWGEELDDYFALEENESEDEDDQEIGVIKENGTDEAAKT